MSKRSVLVLKILTVGPAVGWYRRPAITPSEVSRRIADTRGWQWLVEHTALGPTQRKHEA